MNQYLIQIASSFPQIRSILNLTQEDLSKMIGISRPTLLKIEQDPTKLTKVIALSSFVTLNAEFQKNKTDLNKINPTEYQNTEKINLLPNVLKETLSTFNKSNFNTLIATSAIALSTKKQLGLFIGGTAAAGLTGAALAGIGIAAFKKKNGIKDSIEQKELEDSNEEDIAAFLEEAQEMLFKKEQECLNYFGLETWDCLVFITKINENE